MNRIILTISAALLLSLTSAPVMAGGEHDSHGASGKGMDHGSMGHMGMGDGKSGMAHGGSMGDMHARMSALHEHSKAMQDITDQKKLAEEMKKHMKMMDEMMDEMMEMMNRQMKSTVPDTPKP